MPLDILRVSTRKECSQDFHKFRYHAVFNGSCRNRIRRLKRGDLKNKHTGWPSMTNDIIHNNFHGGSFFNHFKYSQEASSGTESSFWSYPGTLILHELSNKNCLDFVTICSTWLCHLNRNPSLNCIITENEKWITYENVVRKKVYCLPSQLASSTCKQKRLYS